MKADADKVRADPRRAWVLATKAVNWRPLALRGLAALLPGLVILLW
jgi:hypothetical protein